MKRCLNRPTPGSVVVVEELVVLELVVVELLVLELLVVDVLVLELVVEDSCKSVNTLGVYKYVPTYTRVYIYIYICYKFKCNIVVHTLC